jgi:1-pyrroline-4-hydroxy-2-carboxylate deaminase
MPQATISWSGVMPAITTEFLTNGQIDHAFVRAHVHWLIGHGASGIVPCGSLGEGATLERDEKVALIATCVEAAGGRVPVVPGIAALSTATGVWLCQQAQAVGAKGLMILPPYVHKGPESEFKAHFEALLGATSLPCMLYNNPPAYGFDATAEFIALLAERFPNLQAVKESSGDVRRISALRALLGKRLALFAGLDDMVVEAALLGADGWIAGLINALPEESMRLFHLASNGRRDEALALYDWFLPLLRLDCLADFVQWIKLVQVEVGRGSERLRAPRRPIEGSAREQGLAMIRARLAQPR